MRDLGSNMKVLPSITHAAKTNGTVNGTAIDTAGYDGAFAIAHIGVWTDGTHTFSLEESDASGSGFAAVAAAELIGAFAAVTSNANPGTKQKVGYIGKKRYIRVVLVTSGATTGALLGADVTLGFPRKGPLT